MASTAPLLGAGAGAGSGGHYPRGGSGRGGGRGASSTELARRSGNKLYADLDHNAMGGHHAEADIDAGFDDAHGFDKGRIFFITPDDSQLRTAKPLPTGSAICSGIGITFAALSVIGIPYLVAKTVLIRKNEIGLAEWVNGNIRVLTPGWHLLETVNTSIARRPASLDVIMHGQMKIIRVKPGNIGLATANGMPVMLQPGRHVINDPLFVWNRTEPLTNEHITNGTSHIITVRPGKVGLCIVNGNPHFLEPGKHMVNHPQFQFVKMADSSSEHIEIASKHRILVPAGRIGLAYNDSRAITLDSGAVFNIDSPTFKYVGSRDIADEVITHGSTKIITVRGGQYGISFDDGILKVLKEGRHFLTKSTHQFGGFLPSGQQTLHIPGLTCMSSDGIPLKFDSAITILVADASKAVLMLGGGATFNLNKFHDTIIQKAQLSLSIVIGNSRFHHGFQASTMTTVDHAPDGVHGKDGAGAGAGAGAGIDAGAEDMGGFRHAIHDKFMAGFRRQMIESCGVSVIDMSIEDLEITHPEMSAAMARGALARTQLDQAQVEVQINRTKAESQSAAQIVQAQGMAESTRIKVAAEAEAEAAAHVKRAESKAQAIRVIADAEAERVAKIDRALAGASAVTKQRELVLASATALSNANATMVLGNNVGDVSSVLGGNSMTTALTAKALTGAGAGAGARAS